MLARCERDCKWHDRTWTDPSPLHSQWRQHVSLQTFPQSSHRMFVTEVLIYQHCIPRHAANLQETMLREVAPSRVPWGGHGAPHALYFSPEADSPMHRRRFSGVIKQVHGHLVGDDFLPKKSFLENEKGMTIPSVRIGRSLRHRHHARSFPRTNFALLSPGTPATFQQPIQAGACALAMAQFAWIQRFLRPSVESSINFSFRLETCFPIKIRIVRRAERKRFPFALSGSTPFRPRVCFLSTEAFERRNS